MSKRKDPIWRVGESLEKIEAFNRGEFNNNRIQDTKRPICPSCGKELERTKYVGYYEEFDFWDCDCGYEPKPDRTIWGEQGG